MKNKSIRLAAVFLLLATIASVFAGCGENINKTAEESLLLAFEAPVEFSTEEVSAAIDTYRQSKVPYTVTQKDATVTFPVSYDAAASTVMLVSCVDDATPTLELLSYSAQEVPSSVKGDKVNVDTGWWYDADSSEKLTTTWSYLVRVMDTEGGFHYYYFRVNY